MALFTFADAQEAYEKNTNLWYLDKLYHIELLRYANIDNADLQVAWQYGQEYLTPWKDNSVLVEEFFHKHKNELRWYINHRLLRVVRKLLSGIDFLIKPEMFTMLPVEPEIANSIHSGLDGISNTAVFTQHFLDDYKCDVRANHGTTRLATGNMAGFEVLDRLLCGVHDKFPDLARELDDKKEKKLYGVHRHEILENKVYVCLEHLLQLHKKQSSNSFMNTGTLFTNFGVWACILSLIYRLRIPNTMHPNRMDTMYDKYVLRHPRAAQAIEKMRPFGTLTAEAVADDKLPLLNCENLNESVLKQGYSVTATYPGGLIEKYLTTKYLATDLIQ